MSEPAYSVTISGEGGTERVKIDGDWTDAIKRALNTPPPRDGRVEPEQPDEDENQKALDT